ncbi:MAG: flagellar basal body P-ring formation protein FlgA [bacterium]|nr:flagellar basal body P-ring formation protein FlgA [bacterium]
MTRVWGILGSILGLLLGAAAAAESGRIVVPGEVVVSADPIRVRDVAALEGAAEALGDVVLGPAPGAGESRTFDGLRLLDTLKRGGLDPARVTYTLPPLLRVRRATQDVPPAELRALVETHLAKELGPGAADVTVRSVETTGPVLVPSGPWSATVTAPAGAPLVGRVRFGVDFRQDDRLVRTVWVTADIARPADVVVATRAVGRGEVLTEKDVTVERLDLSDLPRGIVTDPAELVGLTVRQPLVPWTPVRREQVGTNALVRRGDAVMIVAAQGALRITTPGEVRADAGRGESVPVLNRLSGKKIVGRVVDARTVQVEF